MTVASGARSVAKRLVPRRIRRRLRPPKPPWVISEPQPRDASPLQSFGFFAIVGTWMEADIIEATIANAFAQGVDRVFVADNDSPDSTVACAERAGADVVLSYRTSAFEEVYRYNLMNELVRHESVTSGWDHIWWLWLDADEFPRPQGGGALRDILASLDRRFRVVGARVLNHYPTPGETAYAHGRHPIEFQPLCEELAQGICAAQHRKHPLQRWDRSGPSIRAGLGFHRAECDERPLFEPVDPIVIHHFPFRSEDVTRRRLEMLWGGKDRGASRAKLGDIATDHMEARLHSLEAVYGGDWASVRNFIPGTPERGVTLTDWRHLDPPVSTDLRLWYEI